MNVNIFHLGLFPHLGATELFFIAFIVLMLFGAKRLPEIAKGFGKAVREFRKSASEFEGDFRKSMDSDEKSEAEKPAASTPVTEVKKEEAEKTPAGAGTNT